MAYPRYPIGKPILMLKSSELHEILKTPPSIDLDFFFWKLIRQLDTDPCVYLCSWLGCLMLRRFVIIDEKQNLDIVSSIPFLRCSSIGYD
jgi:hypothetical protein